MNVKSKERIFLEAVLARPDDDRLRLRHADWLTRRGDVRGEFIRLQCDLARMDPDDRPDEMDAQETRTDELLRWHGRGWAAGMVGPGIHEVYFRRGFAEEVVATADAFLSRGRRWAARTPLRAVQLDSVAGRGEELAACPHLGPLTHVRLDDDAGEDEVVALARSRHAARLEHLEVRPRAVGEGVSPR